MREVTTGCEIEHARLGREYRRKEWLFDWIMLRRCDVIRRLRLLACSVRLFKSGVQRLSFGLDHDVCLRLLLCRTLKTIGDAHVVCGVFSCPSPPRELARCQATRTFVVRRSRLRCSDPLQRQQSLTSFMSATNHVRLVLGVVLTLLSIAIPDLVHYG